MSKKKKLSVISIYQQNLITYLIHDAKHGDFHKVLHI
jgi:hypothetical protein